jgi:ABC-type multidrug transport system fused ATPase/permease subunit
LATGWNAFDRARRFGQRPLAARLPIYLFAALASAVLVALVLVFGLVAELLVSGGNLRVATADGDWLESVVGPPDRNLGEHAEYLRRGLLPLTWRGREAWYGGMVVGVVSRLPALQHSESALLTLVLLGWGAAVLLCLLLYGLEMAVQANALGASSRLRRELHQQARRLGGGDLLEPDGGAVVSLFVDRVEAVREGLVAWWRAIPFAVLLTVLLVGLALMVHAWLTLATLTLAMLSWLMLRWHHLRARRRRALAADRARQHRSLLVEELGRARRLGDFFTPNPVAGETFDQRLRRYEAELQAEHQAGAAIGPVVLFLILGGGGLILLLGGLNVLREPPRLSVAGALTLAAVLGAITYPWRRLRRLAAALARAEQAAVEIFGYLDRQPAVGQWSDAKPLARLAHSLALDHVMLAGPNGRNALEDLSLEFAADSRTVLVSSDRLAPMALAGLVARFYDPTSGRVLFDGMDIRKATLDSVRSQVELIFPDGLLLTGTVVENLTVGRGQFTPVEVVEAAKRVGAYEFLQRLPQGMDTIVGAHGFRLTPVETVMVGLARAVLHNAAVLLVEEPPGVADEAAAAMLADAIERAAGGGRLLLILAHNLHTMRNAQRICLLHEGKLLAEGSHAWLLQECDLYRHLNYIRFNPFGQRVQ